MLHSPSSGIDARAMEKLTMPHSRALWVGFGGWSSMRSLVSHLVPWKDTVGQAVSEVDERGKKCTCPKQCGLC
jgi:hypothetical protein